METRPDFSGTKTGWAMNNIRDLLMGVCLGAANIIPGVSGGTFLLIFNIYERVFGIINCISRPFFLQATGLAGRWVRHPGQKHTIGAITAFCRENDLFFLFKLIIGAVIAILGLSTVMKYLLTHCFSLTYAFFFGLILVSILIPIRLLKRFKWHLAGFACLGAAMTVMVYVQVNPYDRMKHKSDFYQAVYQNRATDSTDGTNNGAALSGLPRTGAEYLYAVLCGAVSISAMVLPSISGSLVLILMGAYYDVLSAISALPFFRLDAMLYLGCFSLGILAGGLLFARLLSFVLRHYYEATMAFLLGLMLGSLWALWPFKQVAVLETRYIRENSIVILLENVAVHTNVNVLPALDAGLGWAVVLFLAGCGIMYGFVRVQARNPGTS
jgi:putative membrane protein